MRLGRLRHRVVIEKKNITTDAGGGSASSWTTHAVRWGEVRVLTSTERFYTGQGMNDTTHVVTVRKTADIDTAMRVILPDERILYIHGIKNVKEGNVWQEIECGGEREETRQNAGS